MSGWKRVQRIEQTSAAVFFGQLRGRGAEA